METRVAALEHRMKRFFLASILCSVVVNPVIVAGLLFTFGKAGPQPAISTGRQEINLSGLPADPDSAASTGPGSSSTGSKDWYTTAEVATRENIAPRTLLAWIEAGRIEPAPLKTPRTWIIPAGYRIQPPPAAFSR